MADFGIGTPVIRECKPFELEPVDVGPFLFDDATLYSRCGKSGLFGTRDYAKFKIEDGGIKVWFVPGTMDNEDSFDVYINKYGQVFGKLPAHSRDILDIVDCAAELSPEDLRPAITEARAITRDALSGKLRPECNNSLDFWGIVGLKLTFPGMLGTLSGKNYAVTMSDETSPKFDSDTAYISSTGAIKEAHSNTYSRELFDKVLTSISVLLDANPTSEYLRGIFEFLRMSAEDPGNLPPK